MLFDSIARRGRIFFYLVVAAAFSAARKKSCECAERCVPAVEERMRRARVERWDCETRTKKGTCTNAKIRFGAASQLYYAYALILFGMRISKRTHSLLAGLACAHRAINNGNRPPIAAEKRRKTSHCRFKSFNSRYPKAILSIFANVAMRNAIKVAAKV